MYACMYARLQYICGVPSAGVSLGDKGSTTGNVYVSMYVYVCMSTVYMWCT